MYNNYRLFKISFLIFCFFCWGCQKEELQPVQKEPEQRISFNQRTFEEVTSIPAIKEMLKGEEKKGQVDLKSAENGSTLLEQEQNFTIDRSRIIEIINNGITSFTMAVQRDYDTPGYFENLMIDVDSEQEVNAYLIRYTPNEEIQDFPAHQTFSFHGKISVVPIQFVGSIAEYDKKHQKASQTICGSTPILICSYGSYDHIAGDECIKQESRTNDGRVTTAWIPNDCNDGGGVLYDGSSYPTNEGIHESGSDGSSTGTTTPIINEDDDAATALTNILELTDQSTIDWLNGHMTSAQEICNFLNSSKQSEEAKDFANAAIEGLMNGGEVDFEEKIMRDPAFLGNPCLNSVYNGLDVSDIATAFLSNFQGHNPVAHLNFSVGVDANYPNANAVTYAPDDFVINIKFNPNKLARPRTSVARTFIHEILHAEMYRKLLSMAQQGSIPWTAQFIHSLKNDFPGLSDYYTRWWLDTNGLSPTGPQHELMAQHYRSTISSFLMQFDPSLTQIQADALAWEGIMGSGQINNTTGLPPYPTVAWNNVPQQTRLNILSIIRNFNNNNLNCQ